MLVRRSLSRQQARLFVLVTSSVWTIVFSFAAQNAREGQPASDEQLQAAFVKKSARELLNQYFQGPPYPLFVIRRLIDLADPSVIPDLERAFAQETRNPNRQFLAAALVNLGDRRPEYFDYVASRASRAAESDLPLPVRLEDLPLSRAGMPPLTNAFKSWVRRHGITLDSAMQQSVFDMPASVEALGEAADPRSQPILLRALNAPNVLVVFAGSLGLARLQVDQSITAIAAAARHTSAPKERRMIAKSLLYFANSEAQQAAERLIKDPDLIKRWREEVSRRSWTKAMRDLGY